MIDLSQDIHSLSDFKRKTAKFRTRLKKTGNPVVLTINGKAEMIVQDAASYQRLLDRAERRDDGVPCRKPGGHGSRANETGCRGAGGTGEEA